LSEIFYKNFALRAGENWGIQRGQIFARPVLAALPAARFLFYSLKE